MSRFFGNNVRPVTQQDVSAAPVPDEGKESVIRNGSMALEILRDRTVTSVQEAFATTAAERLRR